GVRGLHPPDARHHQLDRELRTPVAAQPRRPHYRLRPAVAPDGHDVRRITTERKGRAAVTQTKERTTGGKKRGELTEMAWDPITRIIGNLGIYTKIDFANREVAECHTTSSLFRGYSVFMKGKDPRDAGFITSRICGICGDNHTTCSIYAQNMAYGIRNPPLAEWIINLGEAAEYMFDHTMFQDNLVFVDFCEAMVKATNPSGLKRAKQTQAPNP